MKTIQPSSGVDVVSTSLRLPRDLLTEIKIQAIRAGRSFNTHLVMILREAAGGQFGDQAPAAVMDQQSHTGVSNHAAE